MPDGSQGRRAFAFTLRRWLTFLGAMTASLAIGLDAWIVPLYLSRQTAFRRRRRPNPTSPIRPSPMMATEEGSGTVVANVALTVTVPVLLDQPPASTAAKYNRVAPNGT